MAHLQGFGEPLQLPIPAEGTLRFQPSPSSAAVEIGWTSAGLVMTTPDMTRVRVYGGSRTSGTTALLCGGSVLAFEHAAVEVIVDDDDLFTRAVTSGPWSICGTDVVSPGRHTAVSKGQGGTFIIADATWRAAWLDALRREVSTADVMRMSRFRNMHIPDDSLFHRPIDGSLLRQLLNAETVDLPRVLATTKHGDVVQHASGVSWMRLIERLGLEDRAPEVTLRCTVARAVVKPMVMAERAPPPDLYTVILTWDGGIHCLGRPLRGRPRPPRRMPRMRQTVRRVLSRSTDAFLDGLQWLDEQLFDVIDAADLDRLRIDDEAPAPAVDVDDDRDRRSFATTIAMLLADAPLDTGDEPSLSNVELAAFLRGLFPDEWRAEERRREQLEILSLTR